MKIKPIRFGCTGCGQCCKGRGDVFFSKQDLENITTLLNLKGRAKSDFKKRLIQKKENGLYIHSTGGRCSLLSADDKCTVYEARPVQCRTYPFWPSFFESKDGFAQLKEECEGIGHSKGKVYSALSITRRNNSTAKQFDEIQTKPGEIGL